MASNLRAMASALVAMASTLMAMAFNPRASSFSGYVATRSEGRKPKSSLDYSKFDHIEDSDDDARPSEVSTVSPFILEHYD